MMVTGDPVSSKASTGIPSNSTQADRVGPRLFPSSPFADSRKVIMPSKQSVGNCDVITVEIRDDSPELQAILADISTTSTSSVVKKHNVL